MIEINKISKSFDSHKIIEDISATFDKGKTNLIIGQSGSGKTVLMKCLLGLHEVDNGDILYDGKKFNKDEISEVSDLRKQMGMVSFSISCMDVRLGDPACNVMSWLGPCMSTYRCVVHGTQTTRRLSSLTPT